MEEFICRGKLSSMTLEIVRPHPETPQDSEEQRFFLAKLFYDSQGFLIRKQEPRKTIFFHYNDDGLLEKEVELREDQRSSRERHFQYSADRLLIEQSEDEKITYHYNSKDKLTYSTNWLGSIQESICSYAFDDCERLIQKEIRDSEGALLRLNKIIRDARGLIIEEILINGENIILEHLHYEYPVFHGENWLKREGYQLEEGKDPLLTEIIYRSIAEAPDFSESGHPEEEIQHPPAEEVNEELSKNGEIRFGNGLYKGPVDSEGRPDGLGEFRGRDGSRYTGGFSKGIMEGRGNLLHKNGRSYTGEFLEGLPHGEGECIWPDGSRYRGHFHKGEMHGYGCFTWEDGLSFTGLFEHNCSSDQGLLENAEEDEE